VKISREQLLIIGAFAAIYFIWGSTYLFNWYAIHDIPPFLMSGSRFLTAGFILFAFSMLSGKKLPTRRQWGHAGICGILFLSIGTGGTVWAEQYIDSGITALMIGSEPLIITFLLWQLKAKRPGLSAILGLSIGTLGMYLLVGQPSFIQSADSLKGLIAIFISMIAWGIIAVKLNDFDLPESRIQASAMQMLMGGTVLVLFSGLTGEFPQFAWVNITARGGFSWIYLVIFGSIIAFSSFNFLLSKVSADKVATSNYVNPIVALLLGWGLNNEYISPQSLAAAGLLLFSVFLINSRPLHWLPLTQRLGSRRRLKLRR
jgi:drug/metabolite transporter (DMT)-like permease